MMYRLKVHEAVRYVTKYASKLNESMLQFFKMLSADSKTTHRHYRKRERGGDGYLNH